MNKQEMINDALGMMSYYKEKKEEKTPLTVPVSETAVKVASKPSVRHFFALTMKRFFKAV